MVSFFAGVHPKDQSWQRINAGKEFFMAKNNNLILSHVWWVKIIGGPMAKTGSSCIILLSSLHAWFSGSFCCTYSFSLAG